jgi:hypothetical protein
MYKCMYMQYKEGPLSVQAQYNKSCPIINCFCYNGSLLIWTVVCLTATKFKPLIFPVSGFALSSVANIFIFMILYDYYSSLYSLGTDRTENVSSIIAYSLFAGSMRHIILAPSRSTIKLTFTQLNHALQFVAMATLNCLMTTINLTPTKRSFIPTKYNSGSHFQASPACRNVMCS